MNGGELSTVELGVEEIEVKGDVVDDPVGEDFDDEPPAIEVIAKAGLALPESPITSHGHELLVSQWRRVMIVLTDNNIVVARGNARDCNSDFAVPNTEAFGKGVVCWQKVLTCQNMFRPRHR